MVAEPFVSYAQNCEDVVLARAFAPDENTGFWIDVGAGDPITDSVTQAFSVRGWTGINVEPGPESYELLVQHRPNEINLQCAVGRRAGFAKLYPGPGGNAGLATLVPRIAERHYLEERDGLEPIEVEVRTLAEIADQYAPAVVDFLKVDVEGFEAEVLAGVDFDRLHPRVVVVEAIDPNEHAPSHGAWEPMLLSQGYQLVLFDGLNRFYVAAGEVDLARAIGAPANVLDEFVLHRSLVELHQALVEFERAQGYARSLETTLRDLRAHTDEELAALRVEFTSAQEYALSLEAVVAEERPRFEAELRDLARRCRLMSDRAEHADELVANLRDDLAVAQARGALAMGEAVRLATHLEALEATRTFRSTKRVRGFYGMLRRLGATRS